MINLIIKNKNNMINNFDLEEWAETHYEIMAAIERVEDETEGIVNEMHTQYGIGGKWRLAFELTNEFIELYSDVVWGEELDWFDTLEQFLKDKKL